MYPPYIVSVLIGITCPKLHPLYPSLLVSALIANHLQISQKACLEDASVDISDGDGRLDEPAAAAGDRR
jgi:hypothetical protein